MAIDLTSCASYSAFQAATTAHNAAVNANGPNSSEAKQAALDRVRLLRDCYREAGHLVTFRIP